jgi:hypothetical protein
MMLFNDQGKIENIVPVVRNDAHRIIEECMLAANVCASDFPAPSTSRPASTASTKADAGKLKNLRSFLKEFGLAWAAATIRRPRTTPSCSKRSSHAPMPAAADGDAALAAQAMYSPDNVGHFGLAYEHYTHFTSPIRRYPDLLVHRAIKAVLAGGTRYAPGKWDDIGLHCSMTERRADEATRDVENWLKCYYMRSASARSSTARFRRWCLWHLRRARHGLCRRPGACFRTGRGLLPVRQHQAPDARRAHRPAFPSRRPGAVKLVRARSGKQQDRLQLSVPSCITAANGVLVSWPRRWVRWDSASRNRRRQRNGSSAAMLARSWAESCSPRLSSSSSRRAFERGMQGKSWAVRKAAH